MVNGPNIFQMLLVIEMLNVSRKFCPGADVLSSVDEVNVGYMYINCKQRNKVLAFTLGERSKIRHNSIQLRCLIVNQGTDGTSLSLIIMPY